MTQGNASHGVDDLSPTREHASSQGSEPKVDIFDLRRPERIAKSQLSAILLLHENFVRNAASSLSAYLRTYLSMNLQAVEQISYADFLEKLPASTCFASLAVKPYEGSAVLEINPSLIFPILEILLGGSGKTAIDTEREITEIEQTLLETLFRVLINDLTEAWKTITPIDFSIQSVSTEPQFLQVMSPTVRKRTVRVTASSPSRAGVSSVTGTSRPLRSMTCRWWA